MTDELPIAEYNLVRPGAIKVLAALRRSFGLPEQPRMDEYAAWYKAAMAAWLAAHEEIQGVILSHEADSHG